MAVDVEAAGEAYARLAVDPDLRRRMGEAGRQRVREEFDWSVVIGKYQDLWAELAERRRSDQEAMPRAHGAPAHPLRPDPFRMFADYPTMRFGRDHVVAPAPELAIERFRAMKDLAVVSFADEIMAADEDCERVLGHLIGDGATTLGTLLDLFPSEKEHALWRAVARFAKMGLVRIESPR